jgi:predicted phage tail protein
VPGQLRFHDFISPSSWLHLITHPPFLVALAAAVIGATIYVRIFGARVIGNLLRQILLPKKKTTAQASTPDANSSLMFRKRR